jgi:hypothetical protein
LKLKYKAKFKVKSPHLEGKSF